MIVTISTFMGCYFSPSLQKITLHGNTWDVTGEDAEAYLSSSDKDVRVFRQTGWKSLFYSIMDGFRKGRIHGLKRAINHSN